MTVMEETGLGAHGEAVVGETIPDLLKGLSGLNVHVSGGSEVGSYLRDHEGLADLLFPVCSRLREVMGGKVEICLEIYHDPEFDDHYLTVLVRAQPYTAELLDALANIQNEFIDEISCKSEYLLVHTDYKPPQN